MESKLIVPENQKAFWLFLAEANKGFGALSDDLKGCVRMTLSNSFESGEFRPASSKVPTVHKEIK